MFGNHSSVSSAQCISLFPLNWQYLNNFNALESQKAQADYLFTDFVGQLKQESDQGGYGALLKLAFEQIVET